MTDDAAVREEIRTMLEGGLATEVFPRADTQDEVLTITTRLKTENGSLKNKLVISGFQLTPIEHADVEQACMTCMYFAVHRRHCELPELDLPVEPDWSCRLWRI